MERKLIGLIAATALGFLGLMLLALSSSVALAEEPQGMVGTQTCLTCHEDKGKAPNGNVHGLHAGGKIACESCHGPGKAHVDGGGDAAKIRRFETLKPGEVNKVCLKCHEKDQQVHWVGSTHASRGLSCISCHDPHQKGPEVHKALLKDTEFKLCTKCHLQRKAQLYRSAHMPMLEGKMDCTSCHNPHGNSNPSMLKQMTVNQNCYSCHAEKRGPFLFEHPPVRENCMTCHDPHGSINSNLLKRRPPILCQQCHIGSRHPSEPHAGYTKFAFNKGCLNCHSMIHGSNNPSGTAFQR